MFGICVTYVQDLSNVAIDFKRDQKCDFWHSFVTIKHCPGKLTQCPAGPFLTLSVF